MEGLLPTDFFLIIENCKYLLFLYEIKYIPSNSDVIKPCAKVLCHPPLPLQAHLDPPPLLPSCSIFLSYLLRIPGFIGPTVFV